MMVHRGNTAHFNVWYDDTLTNGAAMADAVLAGCENDLSQLSALFGGIMPVASSLPFQVNLQAGAGSAGHANCLATNISYPAANSSPEAVLSTIDAEVAEVLMATQNLGFNCGLSNGEALSRALPTVLYPERAEFFSSGNDWLNSSSPSRPDFVGSNAGNDTTAVANGCGTLFLNYLAHQLNFTWQQIIAAAGPTLAQTAANLGVANAFNDFNALLALHFPVGTPTNLADDNPFPLLTNTALYIRHNLADNGSSHTGPLANSPDIIVKNNVVGSGTFASPISIYSDTESDPFVLAGQSNYLYLRVWNRGPAAAAVDAAVYWSPPAILVSPDLWTHISTGVLPSVPQPGSLLQVSSPLGWDASAIPAPGHYCFIATVGNAANPAPDPATLLLGSFDDFVNYIYAHNNITWRNFNVATAIPPHRGRFAEFIALPFLITGAWDKERNFALETIATLPKGSRMALQVAHRLAQRLKPAPEKMEEHEDQDTDRDDRRRARIALSPHGTHSLGAIDLPASTRAASHLLVQIPQQHRGQEYDVVIRQTYKGREVGRITWRLIPHQEKRDSD